MRKLFVRTAWIAVGLLVVGLMSGCTLSGAQPAPQTTLVGDTGLPTATVQPTQEVIIIPTTAPTNDVFGTATAGAAQGQTPSGEVTTEATEAGGVVNPTSAGPTATGAVPTATQPMLATATGQTGTGTNGQCPATHTVAAGENLFRIALLYGIDWHDLAAANGITNEGALQIGEVLTIPGCQQNAQPTAAAPGATAAPGGAQTYTVQVGDNLFRIALKFGIAWQSLAAFNNITDPASLQVGQVLQIPAQ
jgi:LysM repeat protein